MSRTGQPQGIGRRLVRWAALFGGAMIIGVLIGFAAALSQPRQPPSAEPQRP